MFNNHFDAHYADPNEDSQEDIDRAESDARDDGADEPDPDLG